MTKLQYDNELKNKKIII